MYRILLLLFFLVYQTLSGLSQFCTPPSADNCENANVLCSLDDLNGFTCQNVDYSNPTACLGSGTSCPNGDGGAGMSKLNKTTGVYRGKTIVE